MGDKIQYEDHSKDVHSLRSGSTEDNPGDKTCCIILELELTVVALYKGIDAEVAEFLAQASSDTKGKVIDEATNKRLRWMIHKRILVCVVMTL